MHKNLSLLVLALLVFSLGCKQKDTSFNLEQKHNSAGRDIVAPGLGTIGLVRDQQVFVYYLSENHSWILDKVSQFDLPENNAGLLAMGMGVMGVLQDGALYFYYLNAENKWTRDVDTRFEVPARFHRISSMRMAWELGFIALEEKKGLIDFYYLTEDLNWVKDETATFAVPRQADDYVMMGGMVIGLIQDGRLSLHYLDNEGQWRQDEKTLLKMPESYQAVFSFEAGTIAILEEQVLRFYEIDPQSDQWIIDETMNFHLGNK